MADNHHAPSAPSEHAPGSRVGPVELWHGAGPLVCPDRRQESAGHGEAALRADVARALAPHRTTLCERLVGLAVSVVARGGASPVPWGLLPAGAQRAWRREW